MPCANLITRSYGHVNYICSGVMDSFWYFIYVVIENQKQTQNTARMITD